ncbi:DUF3052 domain-containing protein [Ruegeria sp. PrR005]|uniref:DUF3052 domain-containing protein n=1 Tax=Ruegeria sp. PrR005 TaxID=2706882 RepID=A0A6B2NUW2_9RHOB|nr:DUF3052 domain-containing protein [Ruegeria sp. PrR005]NDW46513.1 DUF3052 domain-containing protein [Ruegeria sp. PrR005]
MSHQIGTGYSGKPLWQKLGFKPGWIVCPVNPPAHYKDLMTGADGVQFDTAATVANAVHLFLHSREAVATKAAQQISRLAPGGMLWLSWAKKTSPLHAGVTEDLLRAEVLPLGWVDVKVCAVDSDWSGLKFLRRRN